MKKVFVLFLAMMLAFCGINAVAEAETIEVYVTIANGDLVVDFAVVDVADVDGDGALTINDALYIVHEGLFEGGVEAGYASEVGSYGLMITKLWGVENGGSYGYYVNNQMSMGLADPITDGDWINAFVYTDLAGWSDTYCWFDNGAVEAAAGTEFSLTLYKAGYDESWAPVSVPVEGAVILFNGEETGYVTDANGVATMVMPAIEDVCVISAKTADFTMVPPVALAANVE